MTECSLLIFYLTNKKPEKCSAILCFIITTLHNSVGAKGKVLKSIRLWPPCKVVPCCLQALSLPYCVRRKSTWPCNDTTLVLLKLLLFNRTLWGMRLQSPWFRSRWKWIELNGIYCLAFSQWEKEKVQLLFMQVSNCYTAVKWTLVRLWMWDWIQKVWEPDTGYTSFEIIWRQQGGRVLFQKIRWIPGKSGDTQVCIQLANTPL